MMQMEDIERLPGTDERILAYRRYVEERPNHPVAWFNLAVELEQARDYGAATTAARRVRALSPDLYPKLPRRLRELAKDPSEVVEDAPDAQPRSAGDYRILGVESWTESHILYDAVRVADGTPVTLRRVLDLQHDHARAQFAAADTPAVDDADGAPLQVLPRVRGVSLHDLTRGGAVDADVAMRLVRAAALECARLHDGGAVHGDLRPEHVIRGERDGGEERVVLLGARTRGDAPTPWGRFATRSPEEDAGGDIDVRTDVYGLGLLLYQLVIGRPAPPLADRNAGTLEPVASDVDELVRRCLSRDPAARFQSARDLVDAIEDLTARRVLPAQIGKWKLGAQLGETATQRLYAAENVDVPGLRATLEVLDPLHARDPEVRARFLARATEDARVFDGGTLDDGTTYLARERVDGEAEPEPRPEPRPEPKPRPEPEPRPEPRRRFVWVVAAAALAAGLIVAALAFVVGGEDEQGVETLDLPAATPKDGDQVTFTATTVITSTALDATVTRKEVSRRTVAGVQGSAVTRLRIRYEQKHDIAVFGEAPTTNQSSLANKTFLVSRDGAFAAVREDGTDASPLELRELRYELASSPELAPGVPFLTGRRWRRGEKVALTHEEIVVLAQADVGFDRQTDGVTGAVTWVSRDGDVATFRVELVLKIDDPDKKIDKAMQATIAIDVARGRPIEITAEGGGTAKTTGGPIPGLEDTFGQRTKLTYEY